ncbi:bifunctional helix-turn-helix transcriptional regulator/GNAT family N-acetyltransferase [Dongshaea marina]|uniref:bifunctional helix-turn-helix transcriptional regulator/GNAT family N-acetyltransferase n=1 Tax=Dongshaea marina TaxID=2047966 RepID=UPI000D3EE10B|nr:bifunctional helix-turn-helix transcriptional regulator/GNAT family N-acetyltransferase [Dongshaea marina]
MDSRLLRSLSRTLVRELGMLSRQCGSLELSPVEAHLLLELEEGPLVNQQLAERLKVDKSNTSRPLNRLSQRGLVALQTNPLDGRSKQAVLTPEGQALVKLLHHEMDTDMDEVLAQLSAAEQSELATGLGHYLKGLKLASRQKGYRIRAICEQDNPAIAKVIRAVSAEYGLTADRGYGVSDPNLDCLYQSYQGEGSRYWVIENSKGEILGGAGIAPLSGEAGKICELQKMYFMPELRGLGLARRLVLEALDYALKSGYQSCYLETTSCLKEATALYEKLGFEHLDGPLGDTGHSDCEICMIRSLD